MILVYSSLPSSIPSERVVPDVEAVSVGGTYQQLVGLDRTRMKTWTRLRQVEGDLETLAMV